MLKMFGKVTHQGFHHALRNVKHGLMSACNTSRKVMSDIDYGADLLSRVHGAVKPLTDQTDVGRRAGSAIRAGLGEYSKAKGRVGAKHHEIEDTAGRVRAAAPELF